MSTADKLTYLNDTKGLIKDNINLGGGNLTTEPFRQYATTLKNIYKDFLANGIGTLWNNWEKVTGTGTSLSLSPTIQGEMEFTYKGNTSQNGTPTPDSPIPINVVSGDNYIDICGKNEFDKDSVILGKVWNGTSNTKRAYGYINAIQGQEYTASTQDTSSDLKIYITETAAIGTGGNHIKQTELTSTLTFTPQSATKYIVVQFTTTTNDITQEMVNNALIQIVKGNTAPSTYEPYIGNSYQVNLRAYLPSEYTPVEYIESSSTQYIDTGFKPNQDTRVVLDYIDNYTQASFILGARSSNASNQYAITDLDTNHIRSDYNARQQNLSRTIGIRYVLDKNKNITYLYQDGNLVASNSIDYNNFTPNINMYLFNINNNGSVGSPGAKIRLYSCKIYDNGTLVRYFVPCYRNSDNVIGLYDAKNGGFYTNQGTGTFTKGNDIPNGIELCKIGTYEDYIRKSTGINLFDKSKVTTGVLDADGTISSGNLYITDFIEVKPNTNYITNELVGSHRGKYYNASKQAITNDFDFNLNNNTKILTTNEAKYVRFAFTSTLVDTLQFQEGSIALPYEPYGKVWYLHKEIGKVVLNGSENWGKSSSTANTMFYLSGTIPYKNGTTSSSTDLYCNNFEGKIVWANNVIGCELYVNNSIRFGLTTSSTITTVENWKTWLSTHNTIVYYVLANSTNTLIEDTTLIEQLEALKLANSYESQTNISQENNDLPFNLVVKALKNI